MTNILITGYNISFKQNETNRHDFEDCEDYVKVRSSKCKIPFPNTFITLKTPKTSIDDKPKTKSLGQ